MCFKKHFFKLKAKMTRNEQLTFCKRCVNRKMDIKVGLLCKLTDEKATFNGECHDYTQDENIKDYSNIDDVVLDNDDVQSRLSMEELEELKMEQNLSRGVIAGAFAGLIGAIIWGVITVITNYQINYIAIAIGVGVGYTVSKFGKGLDPIFGICGAIISIGALVLGNFFSIVGFIAASEGLSIVDVFLLLDYSMIPLLFSETFSPMDIMFYGFALYMGYKNSFRKFSSEDIDTIRRNKIQMNA